MVIIMLNLYIDYIIIWYTCIYFVLYFFYVCVTFYWFIFITDCLSFIYWIGLTIIYCYSGNDTSQTLHDPYSIVRVMKSQTENSPVHSYGSGQAKVR